MSDMAQESIRNICGTFWIATWIYRWWKFRQGNSIWVWWCWQFRAHLNLWHGTRVLNIPQWPCISELCSSYHQLSSTSQGIAWRNSVCNFMRVIEWIRLWRMKCPCIFNRNVENHMEHATKYCYRAIIESPIRYSFWPCVYGIADLDQPHYNDVIMGAMASQITSLTVVYSIVYSTADQRKHQSSASLAFVRGIHIPGTNGQQRGNVSIWWRHHVVCVTRTLVQVMTCRM